MLSKIHNFLTGYRSRYDYWSNSKLSHWLQQKAGMKKQPIAASHKEWRELDTHNKKVNSIIFWITEELFDIIQDIVYLPKDIYRNIKRYIVNRFVDKTHLIDTKLEKGQWHEVETVLLHGVMETVVDFVEGQKAHMRDLSSRLDKDVPYIKDRREAGLAHLDWEISLGDESPYQSECAEVIKEVYLWWKDKYPKRPDPYDMTGWSDYCDKKENILDPEEDKEKQEQVRTMLDSLSSIEELYTAEEEAMIEKVIKYRRGMWT